MASNSLLEAAVFGARAGLAARDLTAIAARGQISILLSDLPPPALLSLREAMSRNAGVIRDAEGLTRLVGEIADLEARHGVSGPLVAARLVALCALARRESRGGHYRSDYPGQLPPARTFITLKDGAVAALAA